MKTLIIGHRGVGKSSLLKRIEIYLSGAPVTCLDLDDLIAKGEAQSIAEIFAKRGEAIFRELERRYLAQVKGEQVFVAAGAGFTGPVPEGWRCLWLRRSTDSLGRVFLDRPRLDPEKSALGEYHDRFSPREERFRNWAHDVLEISEGFDFPNPFEKAYILKNLENVGGVLTITSVANLREWLTERLAWGLDYFELRDDLLSREEIAEALQILPHDKILYSFRKSRAALKTPTLWDWPLEWGDCPFGAPPILSLHRRDLPLKDLLLGLPKLEHAILKLALPIHDFHELKMLYQWQQQDPLKRVALPMSDDGRWSWFRLYMKNRQPLGFWREATGSATDQPPLLQWLRQNPGPFAAILGDPVSQSRTPAEQSEFFKNVFSIRVQKNEFKVALEFLAELGLTAAAVTAPLKLEAYSICQKRSAVAEELESVNTLAMTPAGWRGTNTDLAGLVEARKLLPENLGEVAVWGGGGTLPILKRVFADAEFFSARTGLNRRDQESTVQPQVVVWGIGRSRDLCWPPVSWQPKTVFDLNYSEYSPGREYAMKTGAYYISGLTMFQVQAQKQREFWQGVSR